MNQRTLRILSLIFLIAAALVLPIALLLPVGGEGEDAGMAVFVRILLSLALTAVLLLTSAVCAALSLRGSIGGGAVASVVLLILDLVCLLPFLLLIFAML